MFIYNIMNYKYMNELKKFDNIDEFEKMNFVLLSNDVISNTIDNNLQKLLLAKRITISELSRKTGVSKQVISNSIVKNTKIDLDSAIKISRVLKTPIEDIFMLKKNSWVDVYIVNGKTVYLNMKTLTMVSSEEKNMYIKTHKLKYYNPIDDSLSYRKLNENYNELFIKVGKRIEQL